MIKQRFKVVVGFAIAKPTLRFLYLGTKNFFLRVAIEINGDKKSKD